MGFSSIIDPVSRLLEYGVLWLGFILLAFLLTSIVAYALMPLWPFGRKAAPPNLVDQTTPGAETSERRKDRALIVGLTGLVVLLIVFTLALWEQREEPVHELERAHAQATSVVAEQATTIANWRDRAISFLATPVAGNQGQSTPIPADVPPRDYSYALPFSSTGTGPVTIRASEVRLFVFRPTAVLKRIEFVKSLTLHVTTVDSSRTGPTSINFTLWDFEDAWGSNRMGNQVAWGQNSIEIQAPDAYVGRTGEIYVEVRNYGGGEDVDLADLNFTLTVLNLDGTETVYAPTQ
jgi:hypothetical protein